jgi:hypothetical protein
MSPGEFLLCTFQGDSNVPPVEYPAEVRFVNLVERTVDCRLDDGRMMTADYSPGEGAWPANMDGQAYTLQSHDIFVPRDADPSANDVALLSFSDGTRALGFVESISGTVNIQLYQQPYPRLSLEGSTIKTSEWDQHPAGEAIASLQRCTRDNSIPAEEMLGIFSNGWWSLATRRDAFAGRIGGAIHPFATVVHTTDVPAEAWDTLIRNWTTTAGNGSCAHFAVGRSADQGIVQLAPITRNANHAGGEGHGSFIAGQRSWHPNLVSIGIELHCAGAVRRIDGKWRLWSDNKPQGLPMADEDVIADSQHAGRGWHKVTDYQYQQLSALLDGLEATLEPLPANCVAHSLEPPPAWGVFPSGRVVGHVSLTAARRGDPWPPTCNWLRQRSTN